MRVGSLLLAIGLAAFPLPTSLLTLIPVMLLMPIGTALLFPATTGLLSQRGDKNQLGQVMGVQHAFGGIARICGPIWAGVAYGEMGQAVPYQVAGAVVFVVAIMTLHVRPSTHASTKVTGTAS